MPLTNKRTQKEKRKKEKETVGLCFREIRKWKTANDSFACTSDGSSFAVRW
jgi:hypothetical protein